MPRVSLGRVLTYAALFAAPALLVLATLAASGRMGWDAAGLVGAALLAGFGGLAWLALAEGVRLSRFVGGLDRWTEQGGDRAMPRQPGLISQTGRDLALEMAKLVRTARRRERGQRRALDSANTILQALHDPLLLVRPDRTVARCNAAAAGRFGDRLIDRDLASGLRNPDVLAAADAVLAGAQPQVLQVREAVPVERAYEVRVHPIPWNAEAGRDSRADADEGAASPTGALVYLHDITAMARAQQLRADFIANASHELRTPLSALMGFIETLRGPARDDGAAHERFLSIMEEQATRMSRLVDDLMSLSRIEQDEHTPPTGRIDVRQVVDRVCRGLELRSQERDMPLEVSAPDDLPLVFGDADQLVQVLQNLVDNALKYGRPRTPVTVTLGLEGQGQRRMLRIDVRDRGAGIPREHLPRLTERFFRVDTARSRAMGGTGLGLAIVKHIVSRHRGRLSIDSVEGEGTVASVFLPAPAQSASGTVAGGPRARAGN